MAVPVVTWEQYAADWSGLHGGADLRQVALVFDWCQDLLTDAQRRDLTARLQKGIADPAAADASVAAVRSRVLAAVALFDHVPQAPQRELERVVHQWWEGQTVPALRAGRSALGREDAYPLFELLHAIRDNANLDLRESFPRYFKDYPIEHLLSYYPLPYDGPEFWNPKVRVPMCFNPAAARSILPLTIKRTEMVLAGMSKAQMILSIKAGFNNKELPAPAPGAMFYMMSRAGYLNDALGHYVPHLMFYFPLTDKSSWGADLPDSPVTLNPQFQGGPEPITEFVIPVGKWSDGTVAPVM